MRLDTITQPLTIIEEEEDEGQATKGPKKGASTSATKAPKLGIGGKQSKTNKKDNND